MHEYTLWGGKVFLVQTLATRRSICVQLKFVSVEFK